MKIENRDMLNEIRYGSDYWEIVEEGDWTQDYKYQIQENVVKHIPTGKFYQYEISRSGSPFTDWYYSYEDELPELYEVEKKSRTIVQEYWGVVK